MEKIISKHDNVNESIKAMRSQGSRLINGTRLSQVAKGKMVALYTSALKQCQSEQSSLEQILTDIQLRRQLYFRQRMADKLSRGSLMMLLGRNSKIFA
jgi:hypothetical protein